MWFESLLVLILFKFKKRFNFFISRIRVVELPLLVTVHHYDKHYRTSFKELEISFFKNVFWN